MKLWLLLSVTQAISLGLVIGLGVIGAFLGVFRSNQAIEKNLVDEDVVSIINFRAAEASAFLSQAFVPGSASLRSIKSFAAANPTSFSSPSTFVASPFPQQWRNSMLSKQLGTRADLVTSVEQFVWFPPAAADVVPMSLVGFGNTSRSFYYSIRNPAVDAPGTQTRYELGVDAKGVVTSQTPIGTTAVGTAQLACLTDVSCTRLPSTVAVMNYTDKTGTSTLIFPCVSLAVVASAGSQRWIVVVQASLEFLFAQLRAAEVDIDTTIPHDGSVYALVDSSGKVVHTTSELESARRSRCIAIGAVWGMPLAAIENCLVISMKSHPDTLLRAAAAKLPAPQNLLEFTMVDEGTPHYIAAPVRISGVNENWAFYSVILFRRTSFRTIIALTIVFAVVEFAIATLFLRVAQVKFRKPLTQLGRVVDAASNLNFAETELSRQELAETEVLELIELSAVCFEMTDAIAAFGKYVPQEVIRELQQTEGLHSRVMTARVLTFIMVDIAGFTTMCESMSAEDLAELAEKYFSVATRTCAIHGATIDKFIGDAIAGFWGAPLDYTTQGFSGCCTALHLQTIVDRLQPTFHSRGQNLMIRIGLHRGHSLVGNIGCESRVTYTAIGATAAVAGKLEGLNKEYDTTIIVSGAVLSDAQRTWENLIVARRLGSIPSEDTPVAIYELCGIRKATAGNIAPAAVARERLRRKAPPTVDGTTRSFLGEPSEGGSMGDMATTVKVSSNGSHTSGEKFAQLTIDEEVSVIKASFFLEEDVVAAVDILSQAAMAAEATDFECAVRYMQAAINDNSLALSQAGIKTQRLDKMLKHYEKAMRSRPNGAWKM